MGPDYKFYIENNTKTQASSDIWSYAFTIFHQSLIIYGFHFSKWEMPETVKTLGLVPDTSNLIKDVLQNMFSYIILFISSPLRSKCTVCVRQERHVSPACCWRTDEEVKWFTEGRTLPPALITSSNSFSPKSFFSKQAPCTTIYLLCDSEYGEWAPHIVII